MGRGKRERYAVLYGTVHRGQHLGIEASRGSPFAALASRIHTH